MCYLCPEIIRPSPLCSELHHLQNPQHYIELRDYTVPSPLRKSVLVHAYVYPQTIEQRQTLNKAFTMEPNTDTEDLTEQLHSLMR